MLLVQPHPQNNAASIALTLLSVLPYTATAGGHKQEQLQFEFRAIYYTTLPTGYWPLLVKKPQLLVSLLHCLVGNSLVSHAI